jgi:predicted phage terminase large subunit-like protein
VLPIEVVSTSADKYTRAQPAARAWNQGRILLPAGMPWLQDFTHEVTNFTGSDKHDDQVDALVGAFDKLASYLPPAPAPRVHAPQVESRWGSSRGF